MNKLFSSDRNTVDRKVRFLLTTGGVFNIVLAIFHTFFYWLFEWESTLAFLSVENRGILLTANAIITFLLLILGMISLLNPGELLATRIGKWLLLFIYGFYILRIVAEFVLFLPVFDISIVAICAIIIVLYKIAEIEHVRQSSFTANVNE